MMAAAVLAHFQWMPSPLAVLLLRTARFSPFAQKTETRIAQIVL
jgi:hypothetical protein